MKAIAQKLKDVVRMTLNRVGCGKYGPDNIFNPAKKVGSSLKYALDHIDTKI